MRNTTANYPIGPLWAQCAGCRRYFDTGGVDISYSTHEGTYCPGCAELIGFGVCDDCQATFPLVELFDRLHTRGYRRGDRLNRLCRDCAEDRNWTFCEECGKHDDDCVTCGNCDYCDECADNLGWHECESCNDMVHRDDSRSGPNDEHYCEGCFCEVCNYCDGCGNVFYCDDMNYNDDGSYCSSCFPNEDCGDYSFGRWVGTDTYNRIGSQRKIGIELETSSCPDYMDLSGDDAWGAKNDPTARGKEFVSAILYGDDGLAAVDRITDFADKYDWEVDDDCGFHLHLDMRGEDEDGLEAIATAYYLTYSVWSAFCPDRAENHYCRATRATMANYARTDDWTYFSNHTHRYEWANWAAYAQYGTLEIRLHHATIDGREVCNWARAHTNFADWASRVGTAEVRRCLWCKGDAEKFDCMARMWQEAGCSDLAGYYLSKVQADWTDDSVFADKQPYAKLPCLSRGE